MGGENPVPCHRVVNREGRLAPEFAFGGPEEQRRLLEGEGVVVSEDGYVDMKTYCVEMCIRDRVKVGVPVKISANGTVAPCVAKDKFCGVVLSLRGGYAAVQMAGYTCLLYTSRCV